MFTFAVWSLCKHRNRVVFENTTLNSKLHDSCLKQAIEYMYCVGKSFRTLQVRYSRVKWNRPMEGRCQLNSDGASLENPRRAGGGGLIRDHRGARIRGYTHNIGFTTSVRASALKNAIISYFTISKSYFINYTIPFYNTPYIQKLYYFTFSLKYYFFNLSLLFLSHHHFFSAKGWNKIYIYFLA